MNDKSSWVIGGTTLIGVGVGLAYLQASALYFVASVLIGVGLGLVLAPLVSRGQGRERQNRSQPDTDPGGGMERS